MKNSLLCLIGALVAVSAATVAVVVAKNSCDNKRKKIKFTECDDDECGDVFFDDEEEFVDYTCQCGECCDDCDDDDTSETEQEKSDAEVSEKSEDSEESDK